jgi:hypothetical protein
MSTFVSRSKRAFEFSIGAYGLNIGTYSAVVEAKAASSASSFASATINVVSTRRVSAMIHGGSEQSVRLGSWIMLDGSASCDYDFANCSFQSLEYTWSCSLIEPIAGDDCLDYLIPSATTWQYSLNGSNYFVADVKLVVFKILSGELISDASSVTVSVTGADLPSIGLTALKRRIWAMKRR